MSANVPEEPVVSPGALVPGAVIGGRFQIESEFAADTLGRTLLARDQKTKKPIAIHLLAPSLGNDRATYELFREEVRTAAKLKHRSLVAIYGVGTHAGDQHFVAREWVQGQSLSELVAERRVQARPLSVRGVYNVIAHVCRALSAMHELTCHGALRPSIVWVTRSGRVKVGDLGTGLGLVKAGRWQLLPVEEQAFLAPEVKAGGQPDTRSDIFGVGALLYVLLTGRSPIDQFMPPSQAHPDATQELDALLLRCLAADPAQRFRTPDEIIAAILPLSAASPEPQGIDFAANMDIDVDIAVSIGPPAPRAAPAASPMPATDLRISPPPHAPLPPQVASAQRPAAPTPTAARAPTPPAIAQTHTPAVQPARPAANTPHVDHVDIAELSARLTKNDGPRWMAVKDGMDHGPFTARELIKLIVDGEVLEQHSLFNMSTNERKLVGEYPDFAEFVHQYKIRRDEHEHAQALARSTKVETRSTAAKFLVLAAAVGAIALIGGGYVMSRRAAKQREHQAELDLAALYESGQVKITGTAGILQHTAHPGGPRRSVGAGSGGGFSSYEDAMNQAMELGDASKGGGERQLTSADVAGVMNRNLNRLFSCVGEELRRGGKLGGVVIDLAILGSGHVAGASVNSGSGAFQHCLSAKIREVQFPSFPAPRMGARYSFNVD